MRKIINNYFLIISYNFLFKVFSLNNFFIVSKINEIEKKINPLNAKKITITGSGVSIKDFPSKTFR